MIATTQPPENDVPAIHALNENDVERLRLGWWSAHESTQVARVVQQAPGLSLWMPATSEYILVGPWRHRDDIVHIRELVAIRFAEDLTVAACQQARNDERTLFLAIEMTEKRQPAFYDRCGLAHLETVLSYELNPIGSGIDSPDAHRVRSVSVRDSDSMKSLIDIDTSAFPWLWRNSVAEFQDYASQTGVELHLLRDGSHNIGYIGITGYPGWGHVDRIAVHPAFQGQGFGRILMAAAIARLRKLGSSRIGLSTQLRNAQSQRLYSSLGFRRQQSGDYRIYGRGLRSEIDLDYLVNGGNS